MHTQTNQGPMRLAVGIAEAARLADLSRRGLENYIKLKILPSRKIGRRRLVLLKDLEKFLALDRPSARPGAARGSASGTAGEELR